MPSILDCRTSEDFEKGHINGATHIDADELDNSWHELPPKGENFELCCYEQDIQTISQLLEQQGYEVDKIIAHEKLITRTDLEQGSASHRLWKGNPLLEDHHQLIVRELAESNSVALDIGCGSGRDAILMAQLGMRVIAIDNKSFALEKVQTFANKSQLPVETMLLDCQQESQQLIELIQQSKPKLIMQSRYLYRPLLDIYQQYLPSGAIVAIHTFLEGAEKFGSPKNPAFLLKDNELAERFKDWELLLDKVHHIADGRPLSLFLAKKGFSIK